MTLSEDTISGTPEFLVSTSLGARLEVITKMSYTKSLGIINQNDPAQNCHVNHFDNATANIPVFSTLEYVTGTWRLLG